MVPLEHSHACRTAGRAPKSLPAGVKLSKNGSAPALANRPCGQRWWGAGAQGEPALRALLAW